MPKTHLSTIWRVPSYLPYVQPELTEELVCAAEKRIGFKLPTEYLALLKIQNGGSIRYGLPHQLHRMIYGIGPHYPSLTEFDWTEDQAEVSFELKGLVPFDGDGHWHLCLDYRKNATHPCVTYVDVECDSEKKIADSFAAYLELLALENDENDFVIEPAGDIEKLLLQVAQSLRIQFEAQDSYDYGYPQYRAACGTDRRPEWIWVSPNLVPCGYVRKDDERYRELRHLQVGTARRYPELSDTCYLLTITPGVRAKVLKAFQAASVDPFPLINFVG